MSDKRIIIGRCEQTGLTISAPSIEPNTAPPKYASGVRWRQHETYFTLEAFNSWNGHWEEVPCVVLRKAVEA